jgi:site-specific DNA-methyltransferase (adenine-specific)
MPTLPAASIDAVIADIPYGTTACSWDTVIPFAPMWEQLKRIAKKNAAILLFAKQPFTAVLVGSAIDLFKYSLIWDKKFAGAFALAKIRPMQTHEDICVFGKARTIYNPQMIKRNKPIKSGGNNPSITAPVKYFAKLNKTYTDKYPISILDYPREIGQTVHPTQKPVALMEYLIRTYTNEGDTVLDFTMGSGTTMVACVNTGRNGIGIELREDYFAIAERRINEAQLQHPLVWGGHAAHVENT